MDSETLQLLQWAMTPEAQPFLQQAGVDPMMIQQGISSQLGGMGGMGSMGGMGGMGGMDPYSGYQSELKGWFDANPDNPYVQEMAFGQYLNSMDPMAQQEMGYQRRTDDLNFALALMELGQEDMARQVLSGYGIGAQMGPRSPQDYQAGGLKSMYGTKAETGKGGSQNLPLYSLLSEATPEVAQMYYEEPTWLERFTTRDPKKGSDPFSRAGLNFLFPGLGELIAPYNKQKWGEQSVRSAYGL
jgi:hypothetical protein